MKRFLRDNWPYLVLLAAIAAIFSPALGRYIMLPSPDSPPCGEPHRIVRLNNLLSGTRSIAVQNVFEALLPPWLVSDATYGIDTFLIAVCFGWFLRIRKVEGAAAAFGGLCFALMGYSLTLFSAGHRGFFYMTLYIALMFALLARAISGASLLHWALAACCAVWALNFQPDFAAIYFILAGAYSICGIVRAWRAAGDRATFVRRTLLGAMLAVGVFAVVGFPTIHTTLTSVLAGRMAQIESEAPGPGKDSPGGASTQSADGEEQTTDGKWIFATNWSLPPNEALEFVAPAVMGRQTGDTELPYWGRLGRSWKWEETHQGFMNFRQHVVYLGAIPLALALFAVLLCWKDERFRFDVRFWSIAWIVGLLLSFGRYTPFYRIFYSLPYCSYIRAPVKFVRIVEFSTAILAAIGAFTLASGGIPARRLRRFSAALLALAAVSGLFALAVALDPALLLSPLIELGADPPLVSAMKANAVKSLLFAVSGFGLVAACTFLRTQQRPLPGGAALAALSAAVAVGGVLMARPFAVTQDVEYKFTDRNIVTSTAAQGMAPGAPVVGLLVVDQGLQRVLRDNLSFHAGVAHPREGINHEAFLAIAGRNGLAEMLETTGCGYVLAPASQMGWLGGFAQPVCGLALRRPPLFFERTANPGENGYVLAKLKRTRPYAELFPRWTVSSEESLLGDVARGMVGGGSTLPVVGDDVPDCPAGAEAVANQPCRTVSVQGIGGATKTRIVTDFAHDAMLLMHRPHGKDNCAWLDGKRVPQYKAGYCDTAVFVPAGTHEVALCNANRNPALTAMSLVAMAAFLAGLVYAIFSSRQRTAIP